MLQDVPYLAVSGFLFLRFFNPAILGPKLFAVKDEHPDQKTERTLKLVAKVRNEEKKRGRGRSEGEECILFPG